MRLLTDLFSLDCWVSCCFRTYQQVNFHPNRGLNHHPLTIARFLSLGYPGTKNCSLGPNSWAPKELRIKVKILKYCDIDKNTYIFLDLTLFKQLLWYLYSGIVQFWATLECFYWLKILYFYLSKILYQCRTLLVMKYFYTVVLVLLLYILYLPGGFNSVSYHSIFQQFNINGRNRFWNQLSIMKKAFF